MLSTYRKSATIHGLGKCAKLREIMSEKIETEEVFISIRRRLRKAMNELFNKTASTLKQQLDEIYEEIENFLTLLGDSEATSLEGSPELLRLVEKLVQEAGTSLTNILRETEPAKAEAHKLGYI